jgi:Epoxide hydrolase N terminus
LNQIPQFTTAVDGLDIHFLHVRSPHPGALRKFIPGINETYASFAARTTPPCRLFPADDKSATTRQLCADAPVLCGLLAERRIGIAAEARIHVQRWRRISIRP